jgi:hypothetical protein
MTDLRDMSPAEKHAALPERIKTLEAILASGAGSGIERAEMQATLERFRAELGRLEQLHRDVTDAVNKHGG